MVEQPTPPKLSAGGTQIRAKGTVIAGASRPRFVST